jgi:hypothetical protein
MGKGRTKRETKVPEASFTWDQVIAWRLKRQFLDQRAPKDHAIAVTAAIGGLQAQVMSAAELGLWARVEDLNRSTVQNALWEDRTLVKVWAMRGTLHLLPSAEYPIWQAAAVHRRTYGRNAYLRNYELTPEELDCIFNSIGEALRGKVLTRKEIGAAVAAKTGSTRLGELVKGSWGSLLHSPNDHGELCFGPSIGQRVRFTRPDEWLLNWQPADPVEAMKIVTRRFFAAYGPATRDEFRAWWGLYAGDADEMLAGLDGELAHVEIDHARAIGLRKDLAEIEASTLGRSVRLLPAFDQYVLTAPRTHEGVIPKQFFKRIYRNQGWVSPVLLVNGQMAGVWKHECKGAKLLVQIDPFFKIPAWAKRGAEAEAERLADFLGGSLELTWLPA